MRALAALVLGIVTGCFTPPDPDVLFSCEPDGASDCPSGYSCEADACCHKNGSDVEASLGACRLTPGTGGGTAVTFTTDSGGTGTGTDTGTGTGATTTTTTTTSTSTSTTTTTTATTEESGGTSSETGGTGETGESGTGSSSTT